MHRIRSSTATASDRGAVPVDGPEHNDQCKNPDLPIAQEGFFVTLFFVVRDQEASKDFYVRILGGKVVKAADPCYIKLANTWLILNSGGGPTPDKPDVILEASSDLHRTQSFLNLRVADVWACYREWSGKGAIFLTPPLDNG